MHQSGQATGRDAGVVLDIGDQVGALVLHTPATLSEREVELAPDGDLTRPVHTVVRERRIGTREVFLAVFPALPAGPYRICLGGAPVGGTVTIEGGAVAEAAWPADHSA